MNARELDLIFFSLSDQTRREILTFLSTRERTFGDLVKEFNISKQALSKHVALLEKAGFVKKQKDGRICHCQFNPSPLQDVAKTVETYKAFWEKQIDKLDNYLETLK